MSNSCEPLVLTGSDAAADRAALARLVAFQRDTPADGLPAATPEALLAALEHFRTQRLGVAADARPWRRVADALVAGISAQPRVALLPAVGAGQQAGPLVHDITGALLSAGLDEPDEIDIAVRWWQAARGAALPVDPDFGETWRAIEWLSLHQALAALGRGPVDTALLSRAVRVALRYGQLKPLLPLLQPLTGAAADAGYTF